MLVNVFCLCGVQLCGELFLPQKLTQNPKEETEVVLVVYLHWLKRKQRN